MKYIVIAHHHGAFLTIKQLRETSEEFVVFVPESQLKKYSAMDDELFRNFGKEVKKAAGKAPVYHVDLSGNYLGQLATFMREINCEGNWTVLQAGTLVLAKDNEIDIKTQFGLVKERVHPKFRKLYTLLGLPEVSDKYYTNVIFVNMNIRDGRVTEVGSNAVLRPDTLYAKSFGTLWCLRYRQMVKEAVVVNVWMEAIREKQEVGEPIAYPYHLYAEYAKKVKKLLPPGSFANILTNADESAWFQDLVSLDL